MRKRIVAAIAATALVLSAAAASAAERYDPDDALDTDILEIDVVCPTDPGDLPDDVTGVVTIGGDDYYVAPAPFDVTDHGGFTGGVIIRSGEPDEPFDETALVVVDGAAYFPYPSEHASFAFVFSFADGTTWTAAATFDDNGCIATFAWTQTDALDVQVEFRGAAGEDLEGHVETDVDEAIELSVVTSNLGEDATLADGWFLGLEVGELVAATSLVIEHCDATFATCEVIPPSEINVIPAEIGDGYIVQVEVLPDTGPLAPGEDDTQYFRATFGETGAFTGIVFLFGEAA